MKKPNIFRRIIMFIVDSWRVVMDVRYNPLKHIPDPSLQTYFMLILFSIWSVAFGMIAIFWLGFIGYNIMTSIIVHLSILIPLAFTNAVFVDAGVWLRPRYYKKGNENLFEASKREAKNVRQNVGVCDVTTLGKIDIKGPDSAEFLNRV